MSTITYAVSDNDDFERQRKFQKKCDECEQKIQLALSTLYGWQITCNTSISMEIIKLIKSGHDEKDLLMPDPEINESLESYKIRCADKIKKIEEMLNP